MNCRSDPHTTNTGGNKLTLDCSEGPTQGKVPQYRLIWRSGIDTDRVIAIRNGIPCRRCLDADQLGLLIGHVAVKTLLHRVHSGLPSLFALIDLVTLKAPLSQLSQVSFLLVHIMAG